MAIFFQRRAIEKNFQKSTLLNDTICLLYAVIVLSTYNKTWCCNKVRQEAHKDNKSY